MNNSTLVGLNLPQWPTSVKDIHTCYLQYTIYKSFMIVNSHLIHHNRRQ